MSKFDDELLKAVFGEQPYTVVSMAPTADDLKPKEGKRNTVWRDLNGNVVDAGWLPVIFQLGDPRPAKEQIEERYAHGGGWSPNEKFATLPDGRIQYPEDDPLAPMFWTQIDSGETLILFEGSWLRILRPDATSDIVRMD